MGELRENYLFFPAVVCYYKGVLLAEGKTAIVICAHNEQNYLGRTIDLVKATGIKADIVVVNDGSTDKTSEIARERGCHVVDLSKNVGKAGAFFAGARVALKTNPTAIVVLDADMVEVPRESLEQLIKPAHEATTGGKSRMCVAYVEETGYAKSKSARPPSNLTIRECSGIRSFSTPALAKVMRAKDLKKLAKGYALERFLNTVLEKDMHILMHTKFRAEQTQRRGTQSWQQGGQRDTFMKAVDKRNRPVRRRQRRL